MIKYSKECSSKLLGNSGQKRSLIPNNDQWILQAKGDTRFPWKYDHNKDFKFTLQLWPKLVFPEHWWLFFSIVASGIVAAMNWAFIYHANHWPFIFRNPEIQNSFLLNYCQSNRFQNPTLKWNSKTKNWFCCCYLPSARTILRLCRWNVPDPGSKGEPRYVRWCKVTTCNSKCYPTLLVIKRQRRTASFVTLPQSK